MWLITERGIGDFLISLSLPGPGSVLTHHAACHHPRTPLPCSREAISDPTIISQTRVQAFHKIKSISVLQTLSWRRKLQTGSQGGNKRRWLRDHVWSTAHTTNPADIVFLLMVILAVFHAHEGVVYCDVWYSVLYTLLCTRKVYESLCAMLKIIALITAGDAGCSNLTANCRNLVLACYAFPVIAKLVCECDEHILSDATFITFSRQGPLNWHKLQIPIL